MLVSRKRVAIWGSLSSAKRVDRRSLPWRTRHHNALHHATLHAIGEIYLLLKVCLQHLLITPFLPVPIFVRSTHFIEHLTAISSLSGFPSCTKSGYLLRIPSRLNALISHTKFIFLMYFIKFFPVVLRFPLMSFINIYPTPVSVYTICWHLLSYKS